MLSIAFGPRTWMNGLDCDIITFELNLEKYLLPLPDLLYKQSTTEICESGESVGISSAERISRHVLADCSCQLMTRGKIWFCDFIDFLPQPDTSRPFRWGRPSQVFFAELEYYSRKSTQSNQYSMQTNKIITTTKGHLFQICYDVYLIGVKDSGRRYRYFSLSRRSVIQLIMHHHSRLQPKQTQSQKMDEDRKRKSYRWNISANWIYIYMCVHL